MKSINLVWSEFDNVETINKTYYTEKNKNDDIFDNILKLKHGMKILDVGCGTGYLTIDIAKKVFPDGSVVGLDRSRKLMKYGIEKAEQNNIRNIEFIRGDGRNIQYPNNYFDLVFSKYMLQNYSSNLVPFVKEMKRVVKDNGKIVAIDRENISATWPPFSNAYQKLLKAMEEYERIIGWGDRTTGRKLYSAFVKSGLSRIFVCPDYIQRVGQSLTVKEEEDFKNNWFALKKDIVDKFTLLNYDDFINGIESGINDLKIKERFFMEIERYLIIGFK